MSFLDSDENPGLILSQGATWWVFKVFMDGCKSQEEFEDPEPKSHEGGGWAPDKQEGVREEKSGKWWGSGST